MRVAPTCSGWAHLSHYETLGRRSFVSSLTPRLLPSSLLANHVVYPRQNLAILLQAH